MTFLKTERSENQYFFLAGGGECGEIIRRFPWAETSLGPPDTWPQSLRIILRIVLNTSFPMFLFWGDDLLSFYNDAFRISLGTEGKHPAIGKKAIVVWSDIWEFIGPLIESVMKTGQAVWFEDQLVGFYRNGKKEDIYWTFSYSPAFGDHEKIEGVVVTCNETTEKVLTLKKLEQSEERFRTMADNIPNLAWMAGEDGSLYWYNKKWYEYTGTTKEQMEGWGWQSVHDPEVLPGVLIAWRAAIAEQSPFEMVFPLRGADGQYRQFLTRILPLRDSEGKVHQWFGTNTDITELLLIRKALKESEQNLRNTILQAPVAICLFRGSTHIVELANDRMFELWGREPDQVMNRPIFDALPEATNQGFEAILTKVYTTGETFNAEDIPITLPRDGKVETVYVNVVYEAFHESDASISGILAVAVDVTAQFMARLKIEEIVASRTQELARSNSDLQKSNADLAQFAHIASHDLQEPVRKIGIFTQMLDKNLSGKHDEQTRNYIQKITSSASRMNMLIRDVLSFSELTTEKESFEMVDLNEVLGGIKMDYELLIEQTHASLAIDHMPVIEGISQQMVQLFGNLIANALKFIRKVINPVIRLSSSKLSDVEILKHALDPALTYYVIRCADNGIGFNPEYSEQIFNIFQRLHRKSEYEGTGIGLAICKKIVINHQGQINADGSSENGAIFNVILPEKQPKPESERAIV
jgi:PAS domain S-box-containing protein